MSFAVWPIYSELVAGVEGDERTPIPKASEMVMILSRRVLVVPTFGLTAVDADLRCVS